MRIIVTVLLFLYHSLSLSATLQSLKMKVEKNKTTVMCTLSGNYSKKVFTLTNPARVVLDLANTSTTINMNRVGAGQGIVAAVRAGHPNPGTLRLVFDVKHTVSIATTVRPLGEPGYVSLQLELVSAATETDYAAAIPRIQTATKKPITVGHAPANTMRDVIVVLDPGHGGKDPGAKGPNHSYEKHVVLAIALKLKQLIDRQPGMHAVLTRDGDYYVGLRKRLAIARKYNADIFVSIHADAFVNQHSHGASVFALSPTGATSEAARWLAEKENYSELGGVNLSSLDDQNGIIRTVLIDLSQTATIDASLKMGTRVLGYLDKITDLHNNKVEQARFVVLKSPDIPSVLIETGFISNPYEERNLTSTRYQATLTQAIYTGLKQYFWDYPPQGTRIEAMSNVNRRLVQATKQPKRPWAPWG